MPQAPTRSFESEDLPATRVPIGRGATLPIPARLPTAVGSLSSAIMPPAPPMPTRDIVVVHSSDLHMDHDYTARLHGGDGTPGLAYLPAFSFVCEFGGSWGASSSRPHAFPTRRHGECKIATRGAQQVTRQTALFHEAQS